MQGPTAQSAASGQSDLTTPGKSVDPERVRIKNPTRQLSLWTRQLAVLFNAGVQLPKALTVLELQCEDPQFKAVLREVSRGVESGMAFSSALGFYPRIFSKVFTGLVLAGESNGQLSESLDRLADLLESQADLQRRLTAAFTYPAFVLGVTVVLTLVVFYAILPNFLTIFTERNIPLPLMTRVLVLITNAVRSPGVWCVTLGLGMEAYVLLRRQAATREGALRLYRAVAAVPGVGFVLIYASLARFCWVMDSLVGSGVPLLKCVVLASTASGSPVLDYECRGLVAAIRDGECMSAYLDRKPKIYPPIMCNMVKASEESGGLKNAFSHLARWFNEETENRVELLSATIEPVLMAVVATIVGFIVIGVFVPLYSIINDLGG